MILDLVQDYIVRCDKCHDSTNAYMCMDDAIKAWENNECTGPLDLLTDDLEKHLSNIKQIYVNGENFCKLNDHTCVCSCVVIDTGELLILIEHGWDSGYVHFSEISEFDAEYFKHNADSEELFKLDKIKYYDNRFVEAIRYKGDDSFLYIFGTENYLLITKSKDDLFEKNQMDFQSADIYFEDW